MDKHRIGCCLVIEQFILSISSKVMPKGSNAHIVANNYDFGYENCLHFATNSGLKSSR